ncbi:MAG: DUF167 domain-containing protein, partial [Fimbriimonadales bacterium]
MPSEITVQVRVIPRAGRNALEAQPDGSFVARVRVPPERGQANEAVRHLLAQHFDVAPSCVILLSGATSRHKRYRITRD